MGSGNAVSMIHDHPIIGFRQDRIGARLICLLNVMRLSRRFDRPGCFLWLSEPDGPYPELADPCDFLSPGFVARHIRVITRLPDLNGRQNLRTLAPGLSIKGFAKALAEGARYECDPMAEAIRFMDESPAAVAAELRQAAEGLEFSDPVRRALAQARQRLARIGQGGQVAIHVRRGDILDGNPWSHSSWPAKYVPDEFFRAFIARTSGPVIAFSDTPAAVAHLAQGDPRVVAVADLIGGADLSATGRDLIELLLMAGCTQVGAPAQSAFSQAASVMGGCGIDPLPHALPAAVRHAADDALLERAIQRPDSFLAPGDLAQSLFHATRHAISAGRAAELVAAFAGRQDFLQRFPFLYGDLALAALGAGQAGQARQLAQAGLQAPLLRHRDKSCCRQALLVSAHDTAKASESDIAAGLISMLFTGRSADGPFLPALAWRLLGDHGPAMRALLFDPVLTQRYARADPTASRGQALPLWTLRSDWSELLHDPRLQGELLLAPDLRHKLAPVHKRLERVETALAEGKTPPIRDEDVALLGFCAAQLRLHGRLKRALGLLHWLNAGHPDDAMTHKRLADACFTAGNDRAGWRWLDGARELAPGHALLHLSSAIRAGGPGRASDARLHLAAAEAAWPGLELAGTLRRKLRRDGAET